MRTGGEEVREHGAGSAGPKSWHLAWHFCGNAAMTTRAREGHFPAKSMARSTANHAQAQREAARAFAVAKEAARRCESADNGALRHEFGEPRERPFRGE